LGRILVGISSWAEPELIKAGFYPPEVKTPAARLQFYASRFNVAEIDSSYHFFPTRHNLELWLENTPDGFTFDVRAFSLFTQHPTQFSSLPGTIREKYGAEIHAKSGVYPHHLPPAALDELWDIFNRNTEAFLKAKRLGAVLFQFPPWFHPEPANYEYISSCRKKIPQFRMAVEFRVGSWLDKHLAETLKFLREREITLVCVDEPQGFKSSVPPVAEVTAPLSIVRFHGRNAENWERHDVTATEKFNYLYNDSELEEWAAKVKAMAAQCEELHLVFKNKHAEFPVKNALQMKRLLGLA
jgi:uncharacterized protein YecE (DUF72 family)